MPTVDMTRDPRTIPHFSPRKREDSIHRYTLLRDENYYALARDYVLECNGLLSPRSFHSAEINRMVKQRSGEPYLIGIELECEGLNQDTRNIEKVSELLQDYLPGKHLCVTDGSLRRGGIEIVTTPLAPSEISRISWYRLLKGLRKAGLWSFEDDDGQGRCGLHISVSRNCLPETRWLEIRRFVTRYCGYFKALSQRESTYYCEFKNVTTKYTAVNLSKSSVVEFRFFRGNLSPKRHIAAIEIIRALVETALRCQREGIRLTPGRYRRELERFPMGLALHTEYLSSWEAATARRGTGENGARRPRRSLIEIHSSVLNRLEALISPRTRRVTRVGDDLAVEPWPYTGFLNEPRRAVNIDAVPNEWFIPFNSVEWVNMPRALQVSVARLIDQQIMPVPCFRIQNVWGVAQAPKVMLVYFRGSYGRLSSFRLKFHFN